jgi:hypothetical protein
MTLALITTTWAALSVGAVYALGRYVNRNEGNDHR